MKTTDGHSPRGLENQLGEIEITRLFLALWNRKAWIIACTAAFTLLGVVYAVLTPPRYYSQATIALKDGGKGGAASSIFSQLGGVGGAVASQLGGGNTNLPKMEIILKSHELAESVIVKNNLLPELFPRSWDSERRTWKSKNPKKIPTVQRGAKELRFHRLQVSTDEKKSVMRVGVTMHTPALAKRVADIYLTEMNNRIRLNVMSDADSNRRYLERQMNNTSDPILFERIQGLIADEIEKSMLMSFRAFEILESPLLPQEKSSSKKHLVVALFSMIGFAFSVGWLLLMRGIQLFKNSIRETLYVRPTE